MELGGPQDIDVEEPVSAAELEAQSDDKETIKQLENNLEFAYEQIRGLGDVVKAQNLFISDLKQRLKDNNIHVLEKSILETTREELAKINASIPAVRTRKVGERQPQPTLEKQIQHFAELTYENKDDVFANMVQSLVKGVDLDKHGIDPKTMMFKPGWGPNGKIPEPVVPEKKKTLLDRILNRFGLYRV